MANTFIITIRSFNFRTAGFFFLLYERRINFGKTIINSYLDAKIMNY